MTETAIYIIDDHAIMREGIRRLLSEDQFNVIGEAETVEDAIISKELPLATIIILDLNLPGISGPQAIEAVRRASPASRILIFTNQREDSYAISMLRSGADSFLCKDRSPDELKKAIISLSQGQKFITDTIATQLLNSNNGQEQQPHVALSKREQEIFHLYINGTLTSEIAGKLFISESTVATHMARIRGKLGVERNFDVVRYGFLHGLIK